MVASVREMYLQTYFLEGYVFLIKLVVKEK